MSDKIKRDETGAEYEEIEGDREAGDGDGDKTFLLGDGCLTPNEIEEMLNEN